MVQPVLPGRATTVGLALAPGWLKVVSWVNSSEYRTDK